MNPSPSCTKAKSPTTLQLTLKDLCLKSKAQAKFITGDKSAVLAVKSRGPHSSIQAVNGKQCGNCRGMHPPSIRQPMLVLWQAESLRRMLQNNYELTNTKINITINTDHPLSMKCNLSLCQCARFEASNRSRHGRTSLLETSR